MKTVFLFLSNEVYTSDLLRTPYIKYLSSLYKVIIFLPFFSEDLETLNYYKHPNIKYISWPKEAIFWLRIRVLRHLAINEFDYLRNTTALVKRKEFAAKYGLKSKLLYVFFRLLAKLGIKITADLFTRLETLLAPARMELFEKYYRKYNPSLLITATPGFLRGEAEFIIMAKRKKISTVAVDFSWDNLSSKAMRMRKPDFLVVWNDVAKQEAIKIHKYKPEQVFISGAVRFNHYFRDEAEEPDREQFLSSKKLNPDLKTVLLSTCSPGVFNKHKEVAQKIINWREKKSLGDVNLYIRLHPKDREGYKELDGIKNVYIDHGFSGYRLKSIPDKIFLEMNWDDLLNLKYTLKYSDLNINCASTISLEACAFDMPVINLFIEHYYNRFHYKPIVESGAVKLVYNDEDLLNAINNYLKNHQQESSERKKLLERYIQLRDGLSYKRSIDFLTGMI